MPRDITYSGQTTTVHLMPPKASGRWHTDPDYTAIVEVRENMTGAPKLYRYRLPNRQSAIKFMLEVIRWDQDIADDWDYGPTDRWEPELYKTNTPPQTPPFHWLRDHAFDGDAKLTDGWIIGPYVRTMADRGYKVEAFHSGGGIILYETVLEDEGLTIWADAFDLEARIGIYDTARLDEGADDGTIVAYPHHKELSSQVGEMVADLLDKIRQVYKRGRNF